MGWWIDPKSGLIIPNSFWTEPAFEFQLFKLPPSYIYVMSDGKYQQAKRRRQEAETAGDYKTGRRQALPTVDDDSHASNYGGVGGKQNRGQLGRVWVNTGGSRSEGEYSVRGGLRQENIFNARPKRKRNGVGKEKKAAVDEEELGSGTGFAEGLEQSYEPWQALPGPSKSNHYPLVEMSPYLGPKDFTWINSDTVKRSKLEIKDSNLFQITYPHRMEFNVYAFCRQGVMSGLKTGNLYIRAECPLSAEEAKGTFAKGQGLFSLTQQLSQVGSEILQVFGPTCVSMWGPQAKSMNRKVDGIGFAAAMIYDKDLVYTFYPHGLYTQAFIFNAKKKGSKAEKTNVHALVENSGNSMFHFKLGLRVFQFSLTNGEIMCRGFLNCNALTLIDRGQKKKPLKELEERERSLDKKLTEKFGEELPEIPLEIPEIQEAAEDAKSIIAEWQRSNGVENGPALTFGNYSAKKKRKSPERIILEEVAEEGESESSSKRQRTEKEGV